jgi:hypothetical protein
MEARKVRAITTKWTCKDLDGKSICARSNDWERKGQIRAKPYGDEGLLQIDLIFNISDLTPGKLTDKVFHLTQKQVQNLRKSEDGAECDFVYQGVLKSDNSLD